MDNRCGRKERRIQSLQLMQYEQRNQLWVGGYLGRREIGDEVKGFNLRLLGYLRCY